MAEQGTRIADRYELLAPLGEGGMGVVWRARDTRLGRAVAVKLLSAGSLGNDRARARMIREARAAATLEHEGIIRVYDVGELEDGGAFLVMELVRGKSLRDELDRGVLSPARAARIAAAAARALDFAHKSGVVHRDVKPDNIMLRDLRERTPPETKEPHDARRESRPDTPRDSFGNLRHLRERVIVVDFGVAKPVATDLVVDAETLAGITAATLTGAGQIVGTPAYLSPEQARGPDVGPETDQWALAVTTFEAISGQRPWAGKGVVEVVASILRDEPISLRKLVPSVPAELEAAIVRALQKEPADRYPDMVTFAEALEDAVSGLPGDDQQDVVTATGPASKRETVSTNGGHSRTPATSPSKKRGSLLALAAAAVVIAGAFALRSLGSKPAGNGTTGAGTSAPIVGALACPQFEVVGVDAPELGAAAAALACDRLQLARGGSDARTLGPAELAGAPSEITPGFPKALFEIPGKREAAVAAAKRAPAWLDGKVDKRVDNYIATIVLRTSDGAEIARGEGHGIELFEAVRGGLAPVLQKVPPTEEELKELSEWIDVRSVDDALTLHDIRTAILIEDLQSLREACAAGASRPSLPPRVAYLAKLNCQRRLRTAALTEPPPALDETTPGALITTALAQGTTGGPTAVRERAARLEKARDATTVPEGKARLNAAAAELYNFIGDERARSASRAAIHASAKAVDWRSNAWHRVAYTSAGDASLAGAVSAWQPWEPIAQALWGSQSHLGVDSAAHSLSIQRAYYLSQRGTYAYMYGVDLTDRGDVESARGVAEKANDDLLRVEILLAEARYGAVLKKVPELVASLPSNDENAALAFRLTHLGVRAALVLDRPADFVGPVVERYVLSEPHHIVDGVMPAISLIHACSLAPRAIGRRCIERIEQLRHDGKLATIFATIETVLAGANRFVADDYVGAAKAWRTLLRSAGWVQGPLRDPVVIAFDRAGELDLAEEVDAPTVALVDLPRTADIAWVRAARRAHKRGDHERARKLAQACIEKWRFADETIPAIQEMRDLLAKSPR
jgi:serine/threonine protein kinase